MILFSIALLSGCSDDTTSPTSAGSYGLRAVGSFRTPGSARDICLIDDTIYVADNEFGVTIWHLEANGRATPLDTIPTFYPTQKVAVARQSGLVFALASTNNFGGIYGFDRNLDQYAIWIGSKGIEDFLLEDISPDSLLLVHCETDNDGIQAHLYYYDHESSFWAEDIRGSYFARSRAFHGIAKSGTYLYAAQGEWGLMILQIGSGVRPEISITEVTSLDLMGNTLDVVVDSAANYAYIACQYAGLAIVDIGDPTSPVLKSQYPIEGVDDAFKVALDGKTVYILDRENGLFVIDVTDPLYPVLTGKYLSPRPSSVTVRASDHSVFLTDEHRGVIMLR